MKPKYFFINDVLIWFLLQTFKFQVHVPKNFSRLFLEHAEMCYFGDETFCVVHQQKSNAPFESCGRLARVSGWWTGTYTVRSYSFTLIILQS